MEGYNKEQVNAFVDYVIKKTEENILTIKKQKEEIDRLKKELESVRSFNDVHNQTIDTTNYLRESAVLEADLIIKQAKDNASMIVNDALLKSKRIKEEKEFLEKSIELYKRKIKSAMKEQLQLMEDIEIL